MTADSIALSKIEDLTRRLERQEESTDNVKESIRPLQEDQNDDNRWRSNAISVIRWFFVCGIGLIIGFNQLLIKPQSDMKPYLEANTAAVESLVDAVLQNTKLTVTSIENQTSVNTEILELLKKDE